MAGLQQAPLGDLLFIYVVASHHPLANAPEPITDATLREHRAVAVADSAQRGGMTMGLLGGQDVLTVDSMQAKIQVQLRGLGGGFLPEPTARPDVERRPAACKVGTARTQCVHALCLGAARAALCPAGRCSGG